MRLATWNVNGVHARKEFIGHWLSKRQPDVVGLQELKTEDHNFPFEAFEEHGYEVHPFGQKSWNGVAIVKKSGLSVEILQKGLPGMEENGARLITALLDDQVTFTSVYCPNGKNPEHVDFQMKLDWFECLRDYWERLIDKYPASAIGGDFNIVPTWRDTWRGKEGDGEMFHTEDERIQLQKLVELNMHDLYRELNPGSTEYSWWDYRGGSFERGQGLRIDMIYGTPEIRSKTQSVSIDRKFREKIDGLTPSDHVPVYADL